MTEKDSIIHNLERRIAELETKYETTKLDEIEKLNSEQRTREVCNETIQEFVNRMLEDPEINLSMVPDSIERMIYVTTMKVVLKSLEKAIENVKIGFLGHEIKLVITPK